MARAVLFIGGNGHCAARLALARDAIARLPPRDGFALREAELPGFDGLPRASSLDALLDAVVAAAGTPSLVYATGVGGLLALALRARGALVGTPLLLQAPVLWGVTRRRFPRLMRWAVARAAVRWGLGRGVVQRRFARRHFLRPQEPRRLAAFFEGYRRCTAFGDLFAWLRPETVAAIAVGVSTHAEHAARITVWWGARDTVVGPEELVPPPGAPQSDWPRRTFPDWGHYPMLDEPDAWVREVAAALAPA